jgi:hypothetical protein
MQKRWVAVSVLGLAAIFAGGWFVAQQFESPAQRAATAAAPDPNPITAPVRRGVLHDLVTARADVVPKSADDLVPQALPSHAVVTATLATAGSTVHAGDAVLAVNGDPVFVLPGRFPFYRSMKLGDRGPDLAQLQAGLTAAGYPVDDDGVFGPATASAIAQLYRDAGFEPPSAPPAESAGAPAGENAMAGGPPARPGPVPATASSGAANQNATTGNRPVSYVAAASADQGAAGAGDSQRSVPSRVAGGTVPLSALLVAGHLPAALTTAPPVGAQPQPGKPLVTLSSGSLVARAGIASSVIGRIHSGLDVQLVGDGGQAIEATVEKVARPGAHQGTQGSQRPDAQPSAGPAPGPTGDLQQVTIVADEPLPAKWAGANVLAKITVKSVAGPALIVPNRAVATHRDQRTFVMKRRLGHGFTEVRVHVLGRLAGQAAVKPLKAGALATGDRVVVGRTR